MGSVAVVYDTNVVVSGIGWGGPPWECLLVAFIPDVEMVTSEAALTELERVLGYSRLPFTEEEQTRYPELLRNEATLVDSTENIEEIDADPDDDKFLEIAVEADVDYIVSGDPHLKDLGEFRGIDILSPVDFLNAADSPSVD